MHLKIWQTNSILDLHEVLWKQKHLVVSYETKRFRQISRFEYLLECSVEICKIQCISRIPTWKLWVISHLTFFFAAVITIKIKTGPNSQTVMVDRKTKLHLEIVLNLNMTSFSAHLRLLAYKNTIFTSQAPGWPDKIST